jgi:PAS domain S-box-containing protein
MNGTTNKLVYWSLGLLTGLLIALLNIFHHPDHALLTALILTLSGMLLLVSVLAFRGRRLRHQIHSSLSGELTELHHEAVTSARRYKSLLDNAGEAIFIIDAASGALQEVNQKALALLGYDQEELALLKARELVADVDARRFTSFFRRAVHRREAVAEGITFRRKNGSTFIGEVNAILLDLGEDKVLQVMARDITFRHRAEREIRQRNRELSILNNIVVRAANQNLQLQKVLDISLLDLLALFEAQAGAIHLLEASDSHFTLAAQSGMGEDILKALRTVDAATPLLGKVVATRRHFSVVDIQKRNALATALAEGGFASIAAIPLITRGEMIGILHLLTTSPRSFTYENMKLLNTIGNQMAIIIEQARLYEELQTRTEELLSANALLERNSHQLALSQKQLRSNLTVVEQANTEMERLNRMKSHFLGMISHEFRTPLTSIVGGSDFLLTVMPEEGVEEWRKVASLIHQGGGRLNEIVSDLLKLARLEARESNLATTLLSLEDLLNSGRQNLEAVFSKRQQRVTFTPLSHLPRFLGERSYLEDVFSELLANASKFTPDQGIITVAARVVNGAALRAKQSILQPFNSAFPAGMEGQCYLEVEVRDTGVGVSRDDQLHIFETFHELGDLRHHSTGKDKFQGKGAGLGLAVVKGVVEAHGGMVWVETPPPGDEGSLPGCSVFVLLPLAKDESQHPLPFRENENRHQPPLNQEVGD